MTSGPHDLIFEVVQPFATRRMFNIDLEGTDHSDLLRSGANLD
jgi:hypothetical protein